MELDTLVTLTTGITLLTCALAVAGVHSYAAGKAQRQALVDRLSAAGQLLPPAAGAASAPWTAACAAPSSAAHWNCAWRRPAWTSPPASSSPTWSPRSRACG